jgi:hypothetical protein
MRLRISPFAVTPIRRQLSGNAGFPADTLAHRARALFTRPAKGPQLDFSVCLLTATCLWPNALDRSPVYNPRCPLARR